MPKLFRERVRLPSGCGRRSRGKSIAPSGQRQKVRGYGQVGAKYGLGLYLTDNPEVAKGYAATKGRGGPGKVYPARLGSVRLADLDKPLPENAAAVFENLIRGIEYGKPFALDRNLTGKQAFAQLKEAMEDANYTTSDAVEVYQNLNVEMLKAGYDGFRHEGGAFRGKEYGPHNVVILFPEYGVGQRLGEKFTPISPESPTAVPGPHNLPPTPQKAILPQETALQGKSAEAPKAAEIPEQPSVRATPQESAPISGVRAATAGAKSRSVENLEARLAATEFKDGSARLATVDGSTTATVSGPSIGGLVIHRKLVEGPKGTFKPVGEKYSVSHAASSEL